MGKERFRRASQADRLTCKIESLQVSSNAACVTFIEDLVEHMENCRQPFCALLKRKQAERRTGNLDALLGAADALRHCRLGDQKRIGNLGRSQTADGPQRE